MTQKPSLYFQSRTQQTTSITLAILFFAAFSLLCYAYQYTFFIPLLLLFLGVHLYLVDWADYKLCWNLGLLLILIFLCAHVILQYTNISPLYVPVAGIGLLTMLLFKDVQLAFIVAFISSAMVSLTIDHGIGVMLTFLFGSLSGIYMVRDARTRGQLLVAGLLISVVNALCLGLLSPDISLLVEPRISLNPLAALLFNGLISAALVVATLKIFEALFGVVTNYSLLELADFNHPLLKKMILEAPGTYHHSLVVSNLAEAAADSIGADSLLARVGAYYHDIGKIVKSEYFTENQQMGHNVHDGIEPSMSRLVVQNHVTEGIELAKKYKLTQAIIDFIPQHHGTSLMYYFYQRALEEAHEGEEVKEEEFRYPGPKPQTRETAITLLADSVEGATRSLEEHHPQNIEDTVRKVINNKFIDGQLDECPLTLKEIEKISATFTRILSAMYHSRVKYPEKKEHKNGKNGKHRSNGKKSAEKNPPQPEGNNKNNPASPAP